jgi:hypothetical protein
LQAIFPENVGGKGVRWLLGYFMGYYTIWLVLVKSFLVPFFGIGEEKSGPTPCKTGYVRLP